MIIFCLNVFNEEQFLEQCLLSIHDKADKIVVVDGAYEKFPHKDFESTDSTIDIAFKYADEIIIPDRAWKNEIEKRNQYLVGKGGDYYFVIDGDEELVGDVKGYREKEDWNIELDRTDDVLPYPIYRLFKHRRRIHYEGTHHCLMIDDELLIKRDIKTLNGCKLIHHNSERNQDRVRDKGTYYRHLQIEEAAFRNLNKL